MRCDAQVQSIDPGGPAAQSSWQWSVDTSNLACLAAFVLPSFFPSEVWRMVQARDQLRHVIDTLPADVGKYPEPEKHMQGCPLTYCISRDCTGCVY